MEAPVRKLGPEYMILVAQVDARIEKVLNAMSRFPLLLPLVALPHALFANMLCLL